jgi:hypothetical protein
MDYTALNTYITSDPAFADMVAIGDDEGIAQEINSRTTPVVGAVSRSKFAMWCGATGVRVAIEDHAANNASPLRASALTLKDFLLGGVSDALDLADAMNQAMLAGWVYAGAIAQEQADDLTAMATTEQPVFGQTLTNGDIAKAFGRMGV